MSQHKPNRCWRCGHPIPQGGYAQDAICPGCRTPTRVCRNCQFFSSEAPKQCTEAKACLVINKQSANACEYFQEV